MNEYKPRFLRYISLAMTVMLTVFFCVSGLALPASAQGADDDIYDIYAIYAIYDRIDDYLSEIVPKTHFPSFAITIVDKDGVLLSKAYGNGSTSAPYLLGSVSKSFTALCVMRLVEEGKVDLNARLCEYLPNVTDGDKITILGLLNHTSGLGEHQNMGNCKVVNKQGVHTYANVNYSLLGKVVEAVSGKTFEEYVTENVFEPLGMDSTFANPDKAKMNGLTDGYENWFGVNVKTACRYSSSDNAWITVPAGYISSSAEDLGRYLQMYLNGGEDIISPESVNEMFYNSVDVDASIPYKYGMGWTYLHEPLKRPALRHSGLVETGMSCIYILPEDGIGIALTVNENDYFVGQDFADRVGWGVVLMLMGDEPNQIGADEYSQRHAFYDAIYLLVIVISVLPLALLGSFKKRVKKGSIRVKAVFILLLHLLLPVFILLLSNIFFATPLWVVRAFVPDMFATIIISASLLFLGGIIKVLMIVKSGNGERDKARELSKLYDDGPTSSVSFRGTRSPRR